jgi:transposase
MRSDGSPAFWEAMRRLAVSCVLDGYGPADVAELIGVHRSSVYRWADAFARAGWAALQAAPVPGRPPKLSDEQAQRVLSWVRERNPQAFGFATEHWTARRVATVVERELGVGFNHRYLNDGLARHGVTPQLPQRVPRERDEAAVAHWARYRWPAIKRGRPRPARRSCSPMRPGC